MQKQILLSLTLLHTFTYAMETPVNGKYRPEKDIFMLMREHESETFSATKVAIALRNDPQYRPLCMFSYEKGYDNVHTEISMATAYAINQDTIKRILIIDEDFTAKTNQKFSSLFKDKIIIRNQIPGTLWDCLYPDKNQELGIDLALYNVNIENINTTKELKPNIISLLYHFIPTVFIISGDTDTYKETTHSLILNIIQGEHKATSFINAPKTDGARQLFTESSQNISLQSRSTSLSSSSNSNPNYYDYKSDDSDDQ